MVQDVREAFRQLIRRPRFAALCVAVLALAGGGVGAVASLLNALVLRPLDIPAAGRLAIVSVFNDRGQQGYVSLPAVNELWRAQDVFDVFCGTTGITNARVEIGGNAVVLSRESVTGHCAQVLGVQPVLGRLISESDSARAEPVVVISQRLWQQQFGADANVLGRTLRVEAVPLTIVGVAPQASSIGVDVTPDVVLPLTLMDRLLNTPAGLRAYYMLGRLRPGVTIEAAQARLSALWPEILKGTLSGSDQLARQYMRGLSEIRLESGAYGISPLRKRYAKPLTIVFTLGVIVLIVACTNVGGLLLALAVAREGDFNVRLALGATRGRVSRELLTEGVLLSLGATLLAIPLAFWFSQSLGLMLWTSQIPLSLRLTPDARVLAAIVLGGLVCGLVVGSPATAFWSLRAERHRSEQSRSVLGGGGWVGKALITAQLALSLVLLFGSGLFMKHLDQLMSLDPGYRADGLIVTRLVSVPGPPPKIDVVSYMRELLGQLSALQSVTGVALSRQFPFVDANNVALTPVHAVDGASETAEGAALLERISPEFFDVVGVGMVRGRSFTWQDDPTHPAVAIVNASLARRLFGVGDPLGKRIRLGADTNAPVAEIVGLVRDASPGDVRISAQPIAYRPIIQEPTFLRNPVLTVRAEHNNQLVASLRRAVGAFGHNEILTIWTLDDYIAQSMLTERTLFALSSFVGGLSLILSTVGLYALLAHSVNRRVRELGLRLALGASNRTLTWMVVRQALILIAIGVLLGLPLALGVRRLSLQLMPALSPSSHDVLIGAVAVLFLVGVLASTNPARRAARTDPATALRTE